MGRMEGDGFTKQSRKILQYCAFVKKYNNAQYGSHRTQFLYLYSYIFKKQSSLVGIFPVESCPLE